MILLTQEAPMVGSVLMSDEFPKGVVLRISHEKENYVISWNYKNEKYKVAGASLIEATDEAFRAVSALQNNGIV